MFPLITDAPFSQEQVLQITGAMLLIAHVDNAGTVEEVAMIQDFYNGFCSSEAGDWPAFATIGASSPAAACFPESGQREMLMAICMMVAFADGIMSADERAALKAMAADLSVGEERFEEILALVKDHMLMQLAGLPDAGSIVAVARELG
jgi:hypothetical protein